MPTTTSENNACIETMTTSEIIDFIVKQTVVMQDMTIKQDIARHRVEFLSKEIWGQKRLIEQAYRKLRSQLNDRATRQRHTIGVA